MQECPTYGMYAAVVLVCNIVRGESLGFTLNGCGQAWPFTGSCWSGGLEATSFASSKADLQSHYGRGVVSVVPAWARWLNRATSSASSRAGDRFLPPDGLERLSSSCLGAAVARTVARIAYLLHRNPVQRLSSPRGRWDWSCCSVRGGSGLALVGSLLGTLLRMSWACRSTSLVTSC